MENEYKIKKWNKWLEMYITFYNKKKRIDNYPGLTGNFLNIYSSNIIWEQFSDEDRIRLVDLIYNIYIREIDIKDKILISINELLEERLKLDNNDFINYFRVKYSKKFIKYISKIFAVKYNYIFDKDHLEDECIGNILYNNDYNIEDRNIILPHPIDIICNKHKNFNKNNHNISYFKLSANFLQLCILKICDLLLFKIKIIVKNFDKNIKLTKDFRITPQSNFYFDEDNNNIIIKNYNNKLVLYISTDSFPIILKFNGLIKIIFDIYDISNIYYYHIDLFLEEIIQSNNR